MTSKPRLRKFALMAHVIASVGWLGAVLVVLALAIAGLASDNEHTIRAAYLAMELTAWSVLVPLALASLATGVIQSLGTKWGLFRHYWVLAKLLITVIATAVLLLYTQTLDEFANVATQARLSEEHLALLTTPSAVLHAGIALLLLLAATTLAMYKPPGLTPYGWRKQLRARTATAPQVRA
jgi:uncharacterized membrane protein